MAEWSAFIFLALVWGSSYLWIKVALVEYEPAQVALVRILLGAAGMLPLLWMHRDRIPRTASDIFKYCVMAVLNTALPFALISWGTHRIDSSLGAVLNGTVPLFTIFIAHFWQDDDRITARRMFGLILGFFGIVTLVGKSAAAGLAQADVLAQLAIVAAALSYATASNFSRRHLRGQSSVVLAALTLLAAEAIFLVNEFVSPTMWHWPERTETWVAMLWLGLLGTCMAYLFFFFLIERWGPTRVSTVAYLFPVIGLLLGFIFLHEPLDARRIAGTALIVGGVVLANLRPGAVSGTPAERAPATE